MTHRRSAARYGHHKPHIVLLSIDRPQSLPVWVTHTEWKNLYNWFSRWTAGSLWARHFVEYMQVFEAKMITQDYNIRGTLTMFDGFKFSDSEPYSYVEGKRLIRLLGDELRKREKLVKALGVDAKTGGRSAITKGENGAVWDFLPLMIGRGKSFTTAVHPSFDISPQDIGVALTVPNSMKGVRGTLQSAKKEGFKNMLSKVEKNLRPILKKVKAAKPIICIHQRRYKSQRSPEIDGRIEVDLRTALNIEKSPLKHQPGWVDCIFNLLTKKKTNMQWGIEFHCPHSEKAMRSAKSIDIMVDAWVAMKPLMDFVIS